MVNTIDGEVHLSRMERKSEFLNPIIRLSNIILLTLLSFGHFKFLFQIINCFSLEVLQFGLYLCFLICLVIG